MSVPKVFAVSPSESTGRTKRFPRWLRWHTGLVVRRSCDAGLLCDQAKRASRARADETTSTTGRTARCKRCIAQNGASTKLCRSRNSEPCPSGRKLHPAHSPGSAPRTLRNSSSRPQAGDYSTCTRQEILHLCRRPLSESADPRRPRKNSFRTKSPTVRS
jgi:hypothetical protein